MQATYTYALPQLGYTKRTVQSFKLRPGRPLPFGATLVPGGVNFSISSRYATGCTLVLFEKDSPTPFAEIPFPEKFRVGNVYTMTVFDLEYENVEYGFRLDGPYDPRAGHWFDRSKILTDPFAPSIGGREEWGRPSDPTNVYQHRARLAFDDFDWEDDRPLEMPLEDLVIYEMHVRGFTRHDSAGVHMPGTYAALRSKIPYLKELGVNCVELLPVCEFDELDNDKINPLTGERLYNYWGYSTVGFFAPKTGFAATGPHGMQVDELKTLVKQLHANGIEVFLDVVFNHTAEGNEKGPYISFRGIDNKTYYMLAPDGRYLNFSGTGNTLNCNNPVVRNMVIDCLRYWASEYHVDGFRFDLASILGRDQNGTPLANPPLLESMAYDPVLAKCKLIAEAWDAGGLYQVGSFPAYGRWAEWNGKYRDALRRFLKGDAGQVMPMAFGLAGSPDLYAAAGRGPTSSINFVTCHDGFTLKDLVSYNGKHNEANGESNMDGTNDNYSWNCGVEGETADAAVNELRRRQMKNAVAMLLVSQGVPMLMMGDEVARTQHGNNNAYCQDNEISWLDWSLMADNAEVARFFKRMIAFRMAHPVLRSDRHFQFRDYVGSGYPDLSWHGKDAWRPDFSDASRTLAFLLDGKHARGGALPDDSVYVAMNMHWETHQFELPALWGGLQWRVCANTGVAAPEDAWEPGKEPVIADQRFFLLGPRSVAVLVAR